MQKNKYLIIFLVSTLITFALLATIMWIRTPKAPTELMGGYLEKPMIERGVKTLIPSSYILNTGLQKDQVPAITEPKYTTVAIADDFMSDSTEGMGIEVGGNQTFYPVQILNHHYVVLDKDAQGSFAVTYCVFCHSGAVYATDKKLRVSQFEYNNNVLLEDEVGNLWQQANGVAVRGDAVGETLVQRSGMSMMTWGDWKEMYPQGRVLSNDTGYERDYGRHPFGAYDANDRVYYPLNKTDERIPKKWLVNGVALGDKQYAFVQKIMAGFGVYQDENIVAFYDEEKGVKTFSPTIEGERILFSYDFDKKQIKDDKTGSVWTTEGESIDGSLRGVALERISNTQAFFMCWMGLYPNSIIPEVSDTESEEVK